MMLQYLFMKTHFSTKLEGNQTTTYLEKAVGIEVYDVRKGMV